MRHQSLQHTLRPILPWIILSIACVLGSHLRIRTDLTLDQRHSLHDTTRKMLGTLDATLRLDIYLTGELPNDLKQLKQATRDLLEECKTHTQPSLEYQFIDLNQLSKKQRKQHFKHLSEHGIQPTNLYMNEKGQRIEKLIFPGALITYKNTTAGILLLQGNKMTTPAEMVNQSIENLEYTLVQAVQRLTQVQRKHIAILRGHGEPAPERISSLLQALATQYTIHTPALSRKIDLAKYDAILITQPQKPFAESEKYLLDQYIMQGGKILFFLDKLRINMNNLHKQQDFAFPLDLRLDDQLFKYGIRINPDLVQDLHAGAYPIIVGSLGNQPQLQLLPWPFFPIVHTFSSHLITKNIGAIYPQFISSIDKIEVPGITHTPLIFSSQYTQRTAAPVHIDLEMLRKPPQKKNYNHGRQPLAYLLEGTFPSLYQNRFLPDGFDKKHFITESKRTKLLVVGSGSLVSNGLDMQRKTTLPLGYDPFLGRQFANQDFVLNALSYMLDETGLIQLKKKTLTTRLLDTIKVEKERFWWQCFNIIAPILLLGILGIFWKYRHKRTYGA